MCLAAVVGGSESDFSCALVRCVFEEGLEHPRLVGGGECKQPVAIREGTCAESFHYSRVHFFEPMRGDLHRVRLVYFRLGAGVTGKVVRCVVSGDVLQETTTEDEDLVAELDESFSLCRRKVDAGFLEIA